MRFFFVGVVVIIGFLLWNDEVNDFYVEKRYDDITEHFDIKINGVRYSMLHYILRGDHELILSETFSGITVKTQKNGRWFLPLHFYTDTNVGSLKSLGLFFSACIYQQNSQYVVFFMDGERGIVNINNKIIHLPSLLLGQRGNHKHPNAVVHK